MSRVKCYRAKYIHNFKQAEIKSNKPENPEKYTSKQRNITAKIIRTTTTSQRKQNTIRRVGDNFNKKLVRGA
jgi:hypothetical protein